MKRLFTGCRRERRQLSLLAAGVLPEAEQPAVLRHLASCQVCRRHFAELQALGGALRALPELTPSLAVRSVWSARWKRALQPVAPAASIGRATLQSHWPGWLSARRAALAGLAATWVLVVFFHLSAPVLPTAPRHTTALAPRLVWQALEAQRRQFAQWRQQVEAVRPPQPAVRPRKAAPRTDLQLTTSIG